MKRIKTASHLQTDSCNYQHCFKYLKSRAQGSVLRDSQKYPGDRLSSWLFYQLRNCPLTQSWVNCGASPVHFPSFKDYVPKTSNCCHLNFHVPCQFGIQVQCQLHALSWKWKSTHVLEYSFFFFLQRFIARIAEYS